MCPFTLDLHTRLGQDPCRVLPALHRFTECDHIQHAFYTAYTTMHILDKQLGIQTGDLNPLDYGLTVLTFTYKPVDSESETALKHYQMPPQF